MTHHITKHEASTYSMLDFIAACNNTELQSVPIISKLSEHSHCQLLLIQAILHSLKFLDVAGSCFVSMYPLTDERIPTYTHTKLFQFLVIFNAWLPG